MAFPGKLLLPVPGRRETLESLVRWPAGAPMNDSKHLTKLVVLCGQCNCGCPELLVDHDAPPERRIVITDDFGQRVQMSADQLQGIAAGARSVRLDRWLAALAVG